jgi:hypothetical protein
MISMDHLQQWALIAPWPDSAQIEQDLIISRALCDLFNEPRLAGKIAFRGGTAIHKLAVSKTTAIFRRHRLGSSASRADWLYRRWCSC